MIVQLRKLLAKDAGFNNHVLVSIVRLTVETNLVTSKDPSFDAIIAFTSRLFSHRQYHIIIFGRTVPREWSHV